MGLQTLPVEQSARSACTWTSYISRWASWGIPSVPGHDVPWVLDFVEPLQRRRLSPLAKASLHVMHACAQACTQLHIVYASRHGELTRTTELLNQMSVGEQVSPTGFSLAVLNATAGLYSIARNVQLPISAVSAGMHTWAMGWLEASLQAQQAQCPVLFVYADEPVPSVYGTLADPPVLHAVAALLHAQPQEGGINWRSYWDGSGGDPGCAAVSCEPASFAWAAALHNGTVTGQHPCGWSWERV
ncbi:beta-ketoacyl synthase chain length factor [Curvibacter sp. CHRR-16]|uniref:beta-ketoacyl synthase chain length factor n=1 Tax=Curvibacter sp. CHRR-16 TaxID=2835872 RepID=UPI001BD95410|nr:beta-ketoacyl synthase chain length factor [Curvibacter sp. CHRR-16]MBT0568744.1 beta-ketoacyl synthase chain length factor [Curvibacter sp. CHRR-16]